jgi:hypothetical protein
MRRAEFPALRLALDEMRFYHGEDLRHWMYAFGIDSWAGLALQSANVPLAFKLIHDVAAAPEVPSTFVRYLLELASRKQDTALLGSASALIARMYVLDSSDEEKIAELRQRN